MATIGFLPHHETYEGTSMFIVAAHHKYKSLLQQFWGDNLVEVINEAKAFCDVDNNIKIMDYHTNLIITWADTEKRQVKIEVEEGNYLAKLANLLTEVCPRISEYPSQFVIYDTDHPEKGLKGSSGGKVVHGKVVHKY